MTLPDVCIKCHIGGLFAAVLNPVLPIVPAAVRVAAASEPPAAQPQTQARTHRVRRGDSLSSLARQFGVSIAELARANDLPPQAKLRRGATLRIPMGGAAPAL